LLKKECEDVGKKGVARKREVRTLSKVTWAVIGRKFLSLSKGIGGIKRDG